MLASLHVKCVTQQSAKLQAEEAPGEWQAFVMVWQLDSDTLVLQTRLHTDSAKRPLRKTKWEQRPWLGVKSHSVPWRLCVMHRPSPVG